MTDLKNHELELVEQFVLHTDRNVFLTGKAGTGKTTLLKKIIDETSKNTAIVAPTGVAAINAGGMTIHSMFQLPTKSFIPNNDPVNEEQFINRSTLVTIQKIRKERRRLLEEIQLLIIDEISMVRADLLDAVDFTMRRIRKNPLPFGGAQLLVIGDLYQLSPVVRDHIWPQLNKFYQTPFFFSSHAWQEAYPLTIELKKIYRQEDDTFISILNNVRNGICKDEDLQRLNENFDHKSKAAETITLTTHNRKANAINETELARLDTATFTLKAKVKGQFNESAYPTPDKIALKKGAQVMFIRNDPEGQYYNGKIGTVVSKTNEGIKVRCESDDRTIWVEPVEWKNTKYVLNPSTNKVEPEEIGSFEQYPLKLAWAVTVHKSQGLTFDHAIVDLEDSFAAGQLYVALSRCRSLDGLILSSRIKPSNIIVDQRVKSFYKTTTIPEDIDQVLHLAKAKSEDRTLREIFSFNKTNSLIQDWEDIIKDKDIPEKAKAVKLNKEIKNKGLDLQEVAKKFSYQLNGLMNSDNIEEATSAIYDRSEKAIKYFTDEIHTKMIVPLEQHRKAFSIKPKTKRYIDEVETLLNHLWHFVNELASLKYREKSLLPDGLPFKRTVLFDPKKKPQKRVKGTTQKTSLEMYLAGKTIEEIAKERSLVSSTILGHLANFITTGQVDILDFMSEEKVKDSWETMKNHPEFNSAELRQKIPHPIEYFELTMVRNWAKFKGFMDEKKA